MRTPSDGDRPTPRTPRDQDDWIAVLVALGTLGGLGGWIVTNGLPDIDPSVSADLSRPAELAPTTVAPAAGTEPAPAPVPPAPGSPSVPPGDRPAARANDPGAATTPGRPTAANSTTAAPNSQAPLTVPAPQVPTGEARDTLAIVRSPLPFTDVPANHWAKASIDALTARGVLNGLPDGTFAPDRPMTRAELATQIANAFELTSTQAPKSFTDINPDYWAAAPIAEAVATGFMTGYPERMFNPDQTVPRLQVLIALATGLGLPTPPAADDLLQPYPDQAEIPPWARDQVAAAIAAGLLSPTGGEAALAPSAPATRAEVAALIYSALTYLGNVEPLP